MIIYIYVILDGFDLGEGILFPFAPSDKCRDKMMNSIAPFWDGNKTWLIPFQIGYRQAAAAPESQSLLLVGTVIMLPSILGYAGYCY